MSRNDLPYVSNAPDTHSVTLYLSANPTAQLKFWFLLLLENVPARPAFGEPILFMATLVRRTIYGLQVVGYQVDIRCFAPSQAALESMILRIVQRWA